MKLIRSKILFLIFIALAPRAMAENSCHSLFEIVRPTEAQLQEVFVELKMLAKQRHSQDKHESVVANMFA